MRAYAITILSIILLASCDHTATEEHPTMTERAIFAGYKLGVAHTRLTMLEQDKVPDCQQVLDHMKRQGMLPDYFPDKEDAWDNIK